jgi:hypothetical protein
MIYAQYSYKLKAVCHTGHLRVDRTIILKWILEKYGVKMSNGLTCLRMGTSGGILRTPFGLRKSNDFLRQLNKYQFVSMNSFHCGVCWVEDGGISRMVYFFLVLLSGSGSLPPLKPIIVHEGENVRLRCAATGNPLPAVEWRKLDGSVIPLGSWQGRNNSTVTCAITVSQFRQVT